MKIFQLGFVSVFAVIMAISGSAHAVLTEKECPPEVGTLFHGKNSGTYCVSKIETRYWWSAFTWCTAIGGKLATWAEACPGTAVGSSPCANMKAGGPSWYAWTAEPIGTDQAYQVRPSDGSRFPSSRAASNNGAGFVPHALCI